MNLRTYMSSFVISVAITVLVSAMASLPRCSAIGILLLPGALVAAIVMPEGINSDAGNAYLVVTGLLDSIMLSFLIIWACRLIQRRSKSTVRMM